ncbi:centriole, cilia and spindle-associated protein [Astyanax mexicanus]|uniref:Centriole, cilia and spindle-associated protein n=1 Tax=Astyanax mexicanus TaxID=7994 RepID=A0A8B9KQX7_ASTMX|nr:centriole, cilia and spindle-associated protein [Astyanax mexicanus]
MVTKRIRSEYMKRFKDPKWETYAKCYEDLVKYRLSRRLLEQAHNPWFWGEWGSDTESSGKSTPLSKSKVEPLQPKEETSPTPQSAKETPEAAAPPQPKPVHQRESTHSPVREQAAGHAETQEKEEEKSREASPVTSVVQIDTDTCIPTKTKSKPRYLHKPSKSKTKHQITKDMDSTKDIDKEIKHPFAMYGSGEKQAEMASKKTHNVGPAASTQEIHESALRAKTRRDVEKQMKRVDKRRAKSVDLEKMSKSKIIPDYNPWMTEYMRCFSARSW